MSELREFEFKSIYNFVDIIDSAVRYEIALFNFDEDYFVNSSTNFCRDTVLHQYIVCELLNHFRKDFRKNGDSCDEDSMESWYELFSLHAVKIENFDFEREDFDLSTEIYQWYLRNETQFYELFDNMKGNFSVNYSLAPFGDFIEQNAYLTINDKYKINPYFRQYFNKNYTFLAAGFNLHNYVFKNGKYLLNSSFDFWSQPENLEFRTKNNEFGFGVKSDLAIRFTSWNENNKSAYFNIGTSYKTKGFIPESPSLKEDFRIHLGFVLSINSKQ